MVVMETTSVEPVEMPKARPGTMWYEDSAIKQLHRDLVKAGMERARQQGKRIGRPRVTERPEFNQRFAAIVERIGPEGLSRRKAARELDIGYATLKRLLDSQFQPSEQMAVESSPPAAEVYCADGNAYAEVLY